MKKAVHIMAETGGGEATESKPVTDPLVAELHKRVREAFTVFDHEHNGTVDVRYGSASLCSQ